MRKGFDNPIQHQAPEGACVPARFAIGDVEIRPATVLAPMAGVTDTVFRRFIRNLGGCGLMMTEFTSADGLARMREAKARRYLARLVRNLHRSQAATILFSLLEDPDDDRLGRRQWAGTCLKTQLGRNGRDYAPYAGWAVAGSAFAGSA